MVKAKECCCGCTLRQGTLIWLWIDLILCCIVIFSSFSVLVFGKSIATVVIIYNLYSLMQCIVGAIISLVGLYGVHENMPQYLTGCYYYLCYEAIMLGVNALFFIIDPSSYYKITSAKSSIVQTPKLLLVIVFLFLIALVMYLAIIVKSLRDSMIEQKNSRGFTQIPADRSALGYGEA